MTDPNALTKSPSKRLPAPALFVGPPSRNASDASLLSPSSDAKASRLPLGRQRSLLTQDSARRPLPPQSGRTEEDGDLLRLTSSNPNAPMVRRQNQAHQAAEAEATSRTEALWAEMQSTLEEVELGAMNGPELTVFRPEHSRALDELRRAQIELAKAWAKSEAEEIGQFSEERETVKETNATNLLASERTEKVDDEAPNSAGGLRGTFDRSELEKETEKDIELSRLRREANDRYFEKVNKGVQEVVVRLEEVAKAMRGVESESKEIWGSGDDASIETKSVTTAPSIT